MIMYHNANLLVAAYCTVKVLKPFQGPECEPSCTRLLGGDALYTEGEIVLLFLSVRDP